MNELKLIEVITGKLMPGAYLLFTTMLLKHTDVTARSAHVTHPASTF